LGSVAIRGRTSGNSGQSQAWLGSGATKDAMRKPAISSQTSRPAYQRNCRSADNKERSGVQVLAPPERGGCRRWADRSFNASSPLTQQRDPALARRITSYSPLRNRSRADAARRERSRDGVALEKCRLSLLCVLEMVVAGSAFPRCLAGTPGIGFKIHAGWGLVRTPGKGI